MSGRLPVRWAGLLLLAVPLLLWGAARGLCLEAGCPPGELDRAGLAWAARGQGPVLDPFFLMVTWGGSILVLAPLALTHALILWRRGVGLASAFLPAALIGASLMAYLSKFPIARERPAGPLLIELPPDPSFPSAHSLQIAAFVIAWCLHPVRALPRLTQPTVILGALAVLLVAWSRLHLQVHYPTDILFGLLAGGVWALLLRRLFVWRSEP